MPVKVLNQISDPALALGIVEVHGGTVRESSAEFRSEADRVLETLKASEYAVPEEKRAAVRKLLKLGGFSATGRNRPAHELLIRDIQERGSFHYINNVVDANNLISMEALVPISIFDADKIPGDTLTVRFGEPGEEYIFNQSGHRLDVKKCIVCCQGEPPGEPVGSPIKDSMATKVFEGATRYLGIMYFPTSVWSIYGMSGAAQKFVNLLSRETGGSPANCIVT